MRKYLDKKVMLAGLCFVSGMILLQAEPCFAEKKLQKSLPKQVSPLRKLESAMASAATKTVRYQPGTVRATAGWYWRKAKKLSLKASRLKIKKKGTYTFRITKKNGKSRVLALKLKKKTYLIPVNKAKKQKNGFYMLAFRGDSSHILGVRDSALKKGAEALRQPKGNLASQVWRLESAGGTGFRLRNENSGLYLTAKVSKKVGTSFTQGNFSAGNRGQVYRCYPAGGNDYYIKNVRTNDYLCIEGDLLRGGTRDNKSSWKFKLISCPRPVSRISIAGETSPVSLNFGRAFSVKGIVTSCYTIKKLTARVVDRYGTTYIQKTVEPMSGRYDLAGVDAALPFGKLAVGNYRYQVLAGDSSGAVKTVLDREFVVYIPGGAVSKTLIYNNAAIAGVGQQSTGNEKEKKACASYALAYCHAILTGSPVSPHIYWSSAANVDCVWRKGGYTTHAFASEQDVLQTAYGQLAAGKPCVLHVTGKTGNQHWLTLIGYRNVVKTSALKASNFIALDPWNGKVITVTDSYQVRTTYRLACKNAA